MAALTDLIWENCFLCASVVAPQGVRGSEGHMVMVVATAERSGTVGEAWE
eukprot:COSAG06_NODE_25114_length_644_cov_10.108257_1_plen_49_part_10